RLQGCGFCIYDKSRAKQREPYHIHVSALCPVFLKPVYQSER
ncbi:MAG: hypothetical protein ACI9C4_003042, partial [Paraglaciecola sp.]